MQEHIINTPIKDLPPLVEVIFLESMYFHSLSFRRINKGLLSIGHGKQAFFIVYSKKLKKTENISIQGFGHLSTADSRPWQKSE